MLILRLAVLAGLSGCVSLHRTEAGNTVQVSESHGTLLGVYGTTSIIDAHGRSTAIAKGSETVPVTVTTTTNDGRRSTTETVSVGYAYGAPGQYASAAGADWYLRGAQMLQYRDARMPSGGYDAGTAPSGGQISARDVKVDDSTACPEERAPANVAEELACNQLDLSAHTDAINSNPAVR